MIGITALLLATLATVFPATTGSTVTVEVTGLRTNRGMILVCMMRDRSHFPNCDGDPTALSRSVRATSSTIEFRDVPRGEYAIAVFHDENGNRKLDTFLGVPREGFGFSRNPKMHFRAPRFNEVDISVAPGFSRVPITLQYLL